MKIGLSVASAANSIGIRNDIQTIMTNVSYGALLMAVTGEIDSIQIVLFKYSVRSMIENGHCKYVGRLIVVSHFDIIFSHSFHLFRKFAECWNAIHFRIALPDKDSDSSHV